METIYNKKTESANKIVDVFISLSIVLSYYLSQYTSFIPGVTVGELILIVSVGLLIILNNGRFYVLNTIVFVKYYAIALVSSIIALSITDNSFILASLGVIITRWVRAFSYVLFYVAFCEGFLDKKTTIRIYKVVCYAIAFYAVLQYVAFILFRIYLPVNILPFNVSRDVSTESLMNVAQSYSMRARGVFVEPGYLAKFLLPGIVLSFNGWEQFNNENIDWISAIILSVAILMSGSVQGIITLAISFVLVGLSQRKLTSKHLLYIAIEIISIAILYVLIQRTGFMAKPVDRIVNLLYGKEIDRSTQLRVYRGFAYWWQLPLEHKIFGVGMGNAANYAFDNQIYTAFDYYHRSENTLGYMSGISSILVTHGFLCAVLFVVMCFKLFKEMGKACYMIFLQYVILLFGGGVFLSVLGVLYFSLAFSETSYYDEKETKRTWNIQ